MTSKMLGGFPVTNQQAAVIEHVLTNDATFVSAGAGSGKTHTMVAAAMTLLDETARGKRSLQANDLAIVTFTTEASGQLRHDVEAALANRAATETTPFWTEQLERFSSGFVGTIHSFCHALLRQHGYGATVARVSTISRSASVFREILESTYEETFRSTDSPIQEVEWPDYRLQELLEQIYAHATTVGLDLDRLVDATNSSAGGRQDVRLTLAHLLGESHQRYVETKSRRAIVDVSDLLIQLDDVLSGSDGELVARKIGDQYPAIFIDEFQDTDRVQVNILRALLPALEKLLVVGDVKQAIYGFRAADHRLLPDLAIEVGQPLLPLNISRRPTIELLQAQNELFTQLAGRYTELGDTLEAYDGTSSSPANLAPIIHDPAPVDRQPQAIAAWIVELVGSPVLVGGEQTDAVPGDIVILCRTNRLVQELSHQVSSLLPDRLQVRPARGQSFYQEPEVVATYRVLRLILSMRDDAVLAGALETFYFPDVDARERIQEIVQYGHQRGAPITDWFRNQYPEHVSWLEELRRLLRTDPAPQFLARLYEDSGLFDRLRVDGKRASLVVLEGLREEARSLFRKEQALTVAGFVDWLRIAILQAFPSSRDRVVERRPPYVRAMTIHQAKGLQWPVVVIPQLARALASDLAAPRYLLHEDGALDVDLPLRSGGTTRSAQWTRASTQHRERSLAEEFRLLYVAITRAQQHVVLVGDRMSPGRTNAPSSPYYAWVDELNRIPNTRLPRRSLYS